MGALLLSLLLLSLLLLSLLLLRNRPASTEFKASPSASATRLVGSTSRGFRKLVPEYRNAKLQSKWKASMALTKTDKTECAVCSASNGRH